ncbi:hypothetical protein FQA39_LY15849 [Lamprigera yunnana]|nr:hypothetical protein FQA39_LY15849 [Lamprigera yunnana]
MKKYFLLQLCFTVVICSLSVPEENYGVKKCVKNLMENFISMDTTVLYVYNKTFGDILPDNIQQPFLTIDVSTIIYPLMGYQSHNEFVILKVERASSIQNYFDILKNNGIWHLKNSSRRKYLIIQSSEDVSKLSNVFSQFLKYDVHDVIVMSYNFNLKKDAVKVFTWDPFHWSNNCGKAFNFKKENNCSSIRIIQNYRKMKNYNNCTVTYLYNNGRRLNKLRTEVAYLTQFFLSVLEKALNVRVVPQMAFDILYDVIQKHNPKFNFIIDSSLLGEEKRIFSTKPGTHFSDNINNIVTILLESGIIDIKRKEYKRYLTNFSYCFHNKLDHTEEPVVLNLAHVYPIFVYWGFGLIVATVVFVGEIVVSIVIMKFKEY